jgi:hypothetical protein
MPTLEQLFKTKKIDGNLTAEKKYDIRNSKDIRVIDGFAINALRRSGVANRLRETRIEEELIGNRAIRGLRSPLLYGTDILRFKEKSTPILRDMKLAASGTQTQDGGLVGKGLAELTGGKINSLQQLKVKAEQTVKKVTDKLGINFPETKIPTRVVNDSDFTKASPHELIDTLTKIKAKSEGNLTGRILSSALKSSTPNQIGNKIVGEALRLGKQQFKKAIFGTNEINLGSIVAQPNIGIGRGKKINLGPLGQIQPKTVYTNKDKTSVAEKNIKGELPKYSKSIDSRADTIPEQNDLASIYSERYTELSALDGGLMGDIGTFKPDISANENYDNRGRFQPYSKRRGYPTNSIPGGSGYELEKNIEVLRGMTKGSDYLNSLGTYSLTEADLKTDSKGQKDAAGKYYDDYDFIPLRFYSIAKETAVSFRATLSGISENLSPTWETNKTLGNPFSYYTYSGIERSITFTFKVFSLNAKEHKVAWEKINFLTGLVYPANGIGVAGSVFITPPFLKLTLGDMFKNAEGFIDSLSYDIDDNSPWEIGFDIDQSVDLEYWKLPRIINVNITYKFLDTMGDSYGISDEMGKEGTFIANRFYSYGGVRKNQKLRVPATSTETNPDGTLVKRELQKPVDIGKSKSSINSDIAKIKIDSKLAQLSDEAINKQFKQRFSGVTQNPIIQKELNLGSVDNLANRLRK